MLRESKTTHIKSLCDERRVVAPLCPFVEGVQHPDPSLFADCTLTVL